MRDYDNDDLNPVEVRGSEMKMGDVPMRGYDREPELETEYKPKKQELLREYEIRLRFLSVGCVVSVGCKEIPFRDIKEAMDYINKYVENPFEEGMKWREIFESEG